MSELLEQTKALVTELDLLKQRYIHNDPPETMKDRAFFNHMKENTAHIYTLLENWEEEALRQVKERKMNIHPQQIASTPENMELLLLHSYYIDVKRKRYMELNHSIQYIFDLVAEEVG